MPNPFVIGGALAGGGLIGGGLFGRKTTSQKKFNSAMGFLSGANRLSEPGADPNLFGGNLLAPYKQASNQGLAALQGGIGALKEMPGIINQGVTAAQGQVGAVGVAGYRRAAEGGKQMGADIKQTLSQRGLTSSTVGASAARAVQGDVQRQNQEVDAQLAGIRANLEQFRTQALTQAAQARAAGMSALASFWERRGATEMDARLNLLNLMAGASAQSKAAQGQQNQAMMQVGGQIAQGAGYAYGQGE